MKLSIIENQKKTDEVLADLPGKTPLIMALHRNPKETDLLIIKF